MMRNKIISVVPLVVVLALSLTVAGCTASKPTPASQVELEFTDQGQATATPSTPIASATPVQSPTKTNTSTTLGKSTTMKQLSDFAPIEGKTVTMNTTKGNIVFELDREKAPLTTLNFLTLAKSGFYDGIVFHRVIPDFMAQFGDPLSKDPSKQAQWGTGGAGYTIPDEFGPGLKHDSEGIVSMANSGPNSGSSQMFITYGPTPWLDGKHAVFGKVTSGMDVLRQITVGDKIVKVTFE
jgi:cyclophilin family peptidyl-prolyl cis-trans isomerase